MSNLITIILSAGFGTIFGISLTYFAWSLQKDSTDYKVLFN